MEQFLKDLASGVLIPIATAIAAGWWKAQSKPEQASGEDRLLPSSTSSPLRRS